MRFRINKDFRNFITLAGVEVKDEITFSTELCAALVKAGVLEDTDEILGECLCDQIHNEQVYKIAEAIAEVIGKSVSMDALLALDECQIIGDFNCPYCGRSLDYYPCINGYDRDGSPRERGSEYICKGCGFIADVENLLDEFDPDMTAEESAEWFKSAHYEDANDDKYIYESLTELD